MENFTVLESDGQAWDATEIKRREPSRSAKATRAHRQTGLAGGRVTLCFLS